MKLEMGDVGPKKFKLFKNKKFVSQSNYLITSIFKVH